MDISFEGKKVLVTGASTGIGAAIAEGFASAGAEVAVHYASNEEAATAVVSAIQAAGHRAVAIQADLTEPAASAALISDVEEMLGPIDVLVNNAGSLVGRYATGTVSREQYETVMELNFGSVVALTNAIIPGMRQRRSGSVINVSSVAAYNGGGPGAALYAASKGAIVSYTRAVAKEVAGDGVRVNALAPGVIETPFHERFTAPEAFATMVATIPAGRAGRPEECVGPTLFLASDELSSYVTGQVIAVNGGQYFN